jgi:hypothetical protein
MNFSQAVVIPPEVMARQVGDETVILNLANGTYFGLDPTGARIWQLLSEGKGLAYVCAALLDEYEISPNKLEADIDRLLGELSANGLVTINQS